MTAPLGFEIEETEGEDLGAVYVAGQPCASCGIPSYTGARCTRCTVAGAPETGFWSLDRGQAVSGPQDGAERAEAVAPEFVCGSRCDHDIPGPVCDVRERAEAEGWVTALAHSRGVRAGARTVADQWSVRFRRGTWQGYAVRSGDAWKSVCVSGEALPPFLMLGVTELREWLEQPDRSAEWYSVIRKRVAEQDKASKIVKCPGPLKCTLHLVALAFVPFGVAVVSADHTHRANGDIKIKKSKKEQVAGL